MQKLITVEETLRLGGLQTIETYQLAKSIFDATVESKDDYEWSIMCAIMNVFLAGRMQGIREERRKRKSRKIKNLAEKEVQKVEVVA